MPGQERVASCVRAHPITVQLSPAVRSFAQISLAAPPTALRRYSVLSSDSTGTTDWVSPCRKEKRPDKVFQAVFAFAWVEKAPSWTIDPPDEDSGACSAATATGLGLGGTGLAIGEATFDDKGAS